MDWPRESRRTHTESGMKACAWKIVETRESMTEHVVTRSGSGLE